MPYRCLIILLLFLNVCFSGFSQVRLPAIFSDHIVLQQKTNAAFWGWAQPGEVVTVTPSWNNKPVATTTQADGKWKLYLRTPSAGGPFTINIAASNTIVLNDVMLGEVWLASGQSNMAFALRNSHESKEDIAAAKLPSIRFFNVKRQYGAKPFDDAPGSEWQITSPQNAGSFSAVAFYFARQIQQKLNVPVGIVYAAWGGTPAEAWTPEETLRSDTVLLRNITRWQSMYNTVGSDSIQYHEALKNWEQKSKTANVEKLKRPVEPWTLMSYNRPWRQSSVLFNGLIHPVVPFAIKGVLWYQGESNVTYADEYEHLFCSMIKGWRNEWSNTRMPFYFVQLPPHGYGRMEAADRVRQAQYKVMKEVPHTGMVATTDVGDMKDIHPTRKRPVGDRLAKIALAKEYNVKIAYASPEMQSAKTRKGKVIVSFRSATPLKVAGNTLNGFELGFLEKGEIVFKPARAILKENKVELEFDQQQPVQVRYAWATTEANLVDGDGLPAFPFTAKIKQ